MLSRLLRSVPPSLPLVGEERGPGGKVRGARRAPQDDPTERLIKTTSF